MRLRILALLAPLVLAACSSDSDSQSHPVHRHSIHTMGTVVSLSIHDTPPEQAHQASRDIEAQLHEFSARWWSWGEGDLGAINSRLREGQPAPVPAALAAALEQVLELAARSDGHFNPAIGKLTQLWGMQEPGSQSEPPAPRAIEALLPIPPAASLMPRDQHINPPGRTMLDSGGFAKGLAVTKVMQRLREHGIERAIVDAGGDLGLLGQPPEKPWRIGVRDPAGGVIARLKLAEANLAVFSSGDYERGFEHEGQSYHHLLDPDDGRPVTHTRAVTVVHNDPLVADIAATAIFVAGPQQWLETARRLEVTRVLRIDANGSLHVSRAMAGLLRTEPGAPDMVIHDISP